MQRPQSASPSRRGPATSFQFTSTTVTESSAITPPPVKVTLPSPVFSPSLSSYPPHLSPSHPQEPLSPGDRAVLVLCDSSNSMFKRVDVDGLTSIRADNDHPGLWSSARIDNIEMVLGVMMGYLEEGVHLGVMGFANGVWEIQHIQPVMAMATPPRLDPAVAGADSLSTNNTSFVEVMDRAVKSWLDTPNAPSRLDVVMMTDMYPKPFVKSSAELKERLHEEERALKDEVFRRKGPHAQVHFHYLMFAPTLLPDTLTPSVPQGRQVLPDKAVWVRTMGDVTSFWGESLGMRWFGEAARYHGYHETIIAGLRRLAFLQFGALASSRTDVRPLPGTYFTHGGRDGLLEVSGSLFGVRSALSTSQLQQNQVVSQLEASIAAIHELIASQDERLAGAMVQMREDLESKLSESTRLIEEGDKAFIRQMEDKMRGLEAFREDITSRTASLAESLKGQARFAETVEIVAEHLKEGSMLRKWEELELRIEELRIRMDDLETRRPIGQVLPEKQLTGVRGPLKNPTYDPEADIYHRKPTVVDRVLFRGDVTSSAVLATSTVTSAAGPTSFSNQNSVMSPSSPKPPLSTRSVLSSPAPQLVPLETLKSRQILPPLGNGASGHGGGAAVASSATAAPQLQAAPRAATDKDAVGGKPSVLRVVLTSIAWILLVILIVILALVWYHNGIANKPSAEIANSPATIASMATRLDSQDARLSKLADPLHPNSGYVNLAVDKTKAYGLSLEDSVLRVRPETLFESALKFVRYQAAARSARQAVTGSVSVADGKESRVVSSTQASLQLLANGSFAIGAPHFLVTANASVQGSVTSTLGSSFATVNTGFGDNEVYPMNQALRATDSVAFAGLTVAGIAAASSFQIGSSSSSGLRITTGASATEARITGSLAVDSDASVGGTLSSRTQSASAALRVNGSLLSADASTGRVGVNTASPQSTLHVAGTLTVDGQLVLTGQVAAFGVSAREAVGRSICLAGLSAGLSSRSLALAITQYDPSKPTLQDTCSSIAGAPAGFWQACGVARPGVGLTGTTLGAPQDCSAQLEVSAISTFVRNSEWQGYRNNITLCSSANTVVCCSPACTGW